MKYKDGKFEELAASWAEKYSRRTLLIEAFILQLLQYCPNITNVCELSGVGLKTVEKIMGKNFERKMSRQALEPIEVVDFYEKSIEKGYSFAMILTNF